MARRGRAGGPRHRRRSRAGRRDRGPSAGRRTARAARAGRPRTRGRGGGRRRRSRAGRGRHQGLGHISSAEVALESPSGRRRPPRGARGRPASAERDVGTVIACGSGALHEQADEARVLGAALARARGALDARGDVDADGRDLPKGRGDVRGRQAAGQGDRHLPGDRGGHDRVGADAGPAGMRPAGGVEQEAVDTASQQVTGPTSRRPVAAGSASDGRWIAAQVARRPATAASARPEPLPWMTSGSTASVSAAGSAAWDQR